MNDNNPFVDEWCFVRDDVFYTVPVTARCKPEDHAALNPGTRKILDSRGQVIWEEPIYD